MKTFSFLFVLLFVAFAYSENVTIIKKPYPTCVESNYSKLVKYKELHYQEDSDDFFVDLSSIVVDKDENIFAYDPILAKIFKYDKNFRFIKAFGKKGLGPGEIGGGLSGRFTPGCLYLRENRIYFGDNYNKKVICFDREGNLIDEIPFKKRTSVYINPVVDRSGNFYLHSDFDEKNQFVVAIYDTKGKYLRGLLDRSKLLVGLFVKTEPILKQKGMFKIDWYSQSTDTNILYSLNNKDELLIYSTSSGYLWIFDRGKLKSTIKIWPKNALLHYKALITQAAKRGGYVSFFHKLIIDQDDSGRFYLQFGTLADEKRNFLYHFDNNGKLLGVLYFEDPIRKYVSFQYKINDKFYGIMKNIDENKTIVVFKEAK